MVHHTRLKIGLKKEHSWHAARDSAVEVNELNALDNYVT